jgi:hypothetical protein
VELVTPRLIAVIEEATRLGREGKIREGNAPLFGLLLLTEFRATPALPAVLEAMALPEATLDALFGESITEDFPRALAVLAADDPDLLESMIADSRLYEYVRSAAGTALCMLVRDGKLSREDALGRLGRQLAAAVAAQDHVAATVAVNELGYLNPLELAGEIKSAFDADLIDAELIDWEYFEEDLLCPERPGECPELASVRPSHIDDTVELVQQWHWGDSEPAPELLSDYLDRPLFDSSRIVGIPDFDDEDEWSDDDLPPPDPGALTIRRDAPRVGRNDPCPCGSGKKYKKCCLKLGEELP